MTENTWCRNNQQIIRSDGQVRDIGCCETRFGAAKEHARQTKHLVAIHGWMDNAASFKPLSQALSQQLSDDKCHYRLLAIELPGHGYSSHKTDYYHLVDYVDDLHEWLFASGLESVTLLGHSLGGIIASCYTAAFPERIEKLICFDGMLPLQTPQGQTTSLLRNAIEHRQKQRQKGARKRPMRLSTLVRARTQVSDLDADNARLIMTENVQNMSQDRGDDAVFWRSDPKVQLISPLRMDEAQAASVIEHIRKPSWLFFDERQKLPSCLLKHRYIKAVGSPGGHYLHMTQVEKLAPQVASLLSDC